MDLHHKARWIFSPIAPTGKPVAADYAIHWNHPLAAANGNTLVYCVMNAHQFRAASKDLRLQVLDSLHAAGTKIPDAVADHHKDHGVKRGMHITDMLGVLGKIHPLFELEV